jgi:cyclic pyranopterin phosphate synthase
MDEDAGGDGRSDAGREAGSDAGRETGSDAGDGLTHTTAGGDVAMVDVGDKPDTNRRAVARGEIHLAKATIDAIKADEADKGDVLATARIGAIQAVKHTWETIPMCHSIPITNVDTEFKVGDDCVELAVAVETTGKTGCEMEALQGVMTGLNVVWDMMKAMEKDAEGRYPGTAIEGVRVVEKEKRAPGRD